jgi:hypothetical protein
MMNAHINRDLASLDPKLRFTANGADLLGCKL